MNKKQILAIVVIFLFLGLAFAPSISSRTEQSSMSILGGDILYVGGSGEGNYSRIQDAIDNASDGDTVFVYDDSSPYYENVVVDKSINVIGENKDTTIIDAQGVDDVVYVFADEVYISGFTIKYSDDWEVDAGIEISNGSYYTYIEDCIIKDNRFGIFAENGSHTTINECIINDNLDGSLIMWSTNWTIINSIFMNRQWNLWIHNSHHNNINNCTFSNSSYNYFASRGIDFTGSGYNTVKNCEITNTWEGISFYDASGEISAHNIIQDCTISNNYGRAITFGDGFDNHVVKSVISNNGRGGSDEGFAIELFETSNNYIENCVISDNPNGGILILWLANNNYIIESTISNNGHGVTYGYGIECGSPNYIYCNNFIGNKIQAYDVHSNGYWDNGELGNYWDDYKGGDEEGDGIGDTPYTLYSQSNQDNYPLILPYSQEPQAEIASPEEGFLYIRNIKIVPFFTTLLLGNIKIKANAANYIYGIERVEFYVDNIRRRVDTEAPYSWTWRLSSHVKHRHTIKVVVFDNNERSVSDEIKVWRFL